MALNEQQFIQRMEELKKTYAVAALSNPADKTSFEYGRHCGFIEGVEKSQKLLMELLHGDDNQHDRKLTKSRSAYSA